MFESFVILKATVSGTVHNPSEKLHGALIRLLAQRFRASLIHGPEKMQLCISPLYEIEALKMVREFRREQQYLFRFAALNEDITNELSIRLAVEPTITLHDVPFEVERVITCDSFTFNEPEMDTLYFISPLTFRIAKNVNLPLPVPEKIAKSLARTMKREVELPPIQEFFGGTKALHFSHHVIVGFVGYMKFAKPVRELALAHFAGLGYSTARGLGSVLVKGVKPSLEEIGNFHARFMSREEKRHRG
jgi:CRISPR-associated endoribonuclease Cas6